MQEWSREVRLQRQDRTESAFCLARIPNHIPLEAHHILAPLFPTTHLEKVVQVDIVGVIQSWSAHRVPPDCSQPCAVTRQ